jgi:invasion protein IalB
LLALRLVEENRQQNLGSWILGRNNEGALVAVLQTAMFQTPNSSAGLLISKGIELKLGTAGIRRLTYSACEPQRCEASIPMDDAMVKEAVAAANATITIYARDGTALNINVPSIKGIDKAVAALGK